MSYYSDWTGLVPQQPPPGGDNVWVNLLNISELDVWTDGLSDRHASYLYMLVGHTTKMRPGEVISTESLRWSPAGGLVACVLDSSSSGLGVYVWSVSNNTIMWIDPPEAQARQSGWNPNGTVLALSCNASGSWNIWIAEYSPYNPVATY